MTEPDFLNAFNQPWQVELKDEPFTTATRDAAVLICLFNYNGELHILFTQRAAHLKHHAGQISFPGGKAEHHDENLVDTAYREAEEEIGLHRKHLKLVGYLPTYKTISGFAVKPIVSIYQAQLNPYKDLILDANEVANAFSVPLAFLMTKKHYHIEMLHRKNERFPVYFIPFQDKMIWGATAGMLAQLQTHINTYY